MRTSDAIADLTAALAKAQGSLRPAVKDSVNPAFKAKYADLTAVWDACRNPLTAHGLSVVQDVTTDEHGVSVTTRLYHTSGQWLEFGPLVVPLAKRDAHGVGSATSYARRYALSAAVGIVSDDDDGNAAVQPVAGRLVNELPTAPVMPDGFQDWLDDLSATADNGYPAFAHAWKAAPEVMRTYGTSQHKATLTALRKRAETVKTSA